MVMDNFFKKIDIFNFLRGFALLCVIGLHTYCVINPEYPEIPHSWIFNTPAWLAMWIFFFLSGYLLGKGFYNGKYEFSTQGILKFYKSRLIKILPMYLLLLLVLFIFYNPMWFIENPVKVLNMFTFTLGNKDTIIGVGATWFISTIMQLYLLAPFGYKLLSKYNKNKFALLVLILALGIGYRLLADLFKIDYEHWVYTFSLANLDLFFGGMFMNAITKVSPDNKLKSYLRPISLLALFTIIFLWMFPTIHVSSWLYRYCYPTFTLASLFLIVWAHDYKDKPRPEPLDLLTLLKKPYRIVEYLGIISFTFYLYHSNVLEMCMNTLKDPNFPIAISDNHFYVCTYLMMFAITFVLSVFLHYALEVPMNKIRNKN